MVGLRYIGRKALPYTDGVYKTGFVWQDRDTVVWMEEPVAGKFLRHPDAWQRVDQDPPAKARLEKPIFVEDVRIEETDVQAPLVQLDSLDSEGLRAFAQRHFNQRLHPNMSDKNMRARILNWMNGAMTSG